MIELKEWNNGICSISGKPWVLIDDYKGPKYGSTNYGLGYTDNKGHYLWLSYRPDM